MFSRFVAFTIVFSSAASDARAVAPTLNEDLRKELLRMIKVDQDMRTEFIAWTKRAGVTDSDALKKSKATELEKFDEVDRKNTARMKEIVETHGWPGKSLAGKDGTNAAWLLVQHADKDPEFQQKCLRLMKDLSKGEVPGQNLAYLTDRVLVVQKKKQIYGTQCRILDGQVKFQPIEDEANVDKRRAEIGLQSLAEYKKLIEKMYMPESKPKK